MLPGGRSVPVIVKTQDSARAYCFVYWRHPGGMRCGVLHVTCPGLMHVQRPGRRVAGCGSHRRSADGRCVVLRACDGGLKFLPCACAFDGFLLWFLLVSTGLPLRLFETDAEANCIHECEEPLSMAQCSLSRPCSPLMCFAFDTQLQRSRNTAFSSCVVNYWFMFVNRSFEI